MFVYIYACILATVFIVGVLVGKFLAAVLSKTEYMIDIEKNIEIQMKYGILIPKMNTL